MENDNLENLEQVPSSEEPQAGVEETALPLPSTSADAAAVNDEEKGRVSEFMSNIRLLSPVNTEQRNDVINHTSTYAENPLTYSIGFILFLDFMERFAFNGVLFTMSGYLTGYYEPYWNPDYAPYQANTYIATFQGIGFVTPFIVAFVADCLIGDYWTINLFTGLCYIPGILLIAISSIPYSGGSGDFPLEQLKLGTHILYPLGFVSLTYRLIISSFLSSKTHNVVSSLQGAAKTLYGVYAAKQYDPINHSDQIESSSFFSLELNSLGVSWVHWYQLLLPINSRLTKAAPMDWS